MRRATNRIKKYARANKNRDVRAEKWFRYVLMQNRIEYQRQKIIGSFIVDFFLGKYNIIIEIDEPHHEKQKNKDQKRQAYLEKQGFTVVRFKDAEVYNDPWACVERLLNMGVEQTGRPWS